MERRTSTRFFYFFLLLLLPFSFAMAQTAKVTGTVTDEKNQPVAYATVAVVGTANGTTTDLTGKFQLTIDKPGTYTIQVSYVGYANSQQQVVIAGAETQTIAIQIKPTTNNLNELVVIGYGTAKKADLTGSVSSIDAKDFNTGDVQTPEELIQGKVAGVVVTPGGGSPGDGATIRIRGLSSFSASNNPLYVIDGVPIDVDLSIPGSPNPLSLINPSDIENITILKDASATAIYGSRAANGVIIITTKRGSTGKFKVNVSSTNSISQVQKEVSVLSAAQFRSLVDQYGTSAQKALLGTASTDWQKQIYHIAPSTDDNISFSGGLKNTPYRLSLEYSDQNGILITDNMQRGALDFTANRSFLKNTLTITVNLKGSMTQNLFANQGSVGGAVGFDPTQPVTVNSSRYGGYFEWLNSTGTPASLAPFNPLGLIKEKRDFSDVYRSIGNIQIDYKFPFLKGLSANLNTGYDVSEGKGSVSIPDSAASNYNNSHYVAGNPKDAIYQWAKGSLNNYNQTNKNDVLDFTLDYKKDFKPIKSVFDLTAGYSFANFLTTAPNYYSYYQNGDTIPGSKATYPTYNENTLISFFGRFNYAFSDKYLLTATLRDDGSSRFAPDVRWGLFPSAALAWRISEESFLKNSKVVSDLKLRLGYGEVGNQDGISDYPYQSQYYYSNQTGEYQFGNQFYSTLRPSAVDPNLKWESTATSNIAIDYGFLKNRIFGSIDYYYKKTTDMIGTIFIPQGVNFGNQLTTNVGSMQNQGVEGSANFVIISKKI